VFLIQNHPNFYHKEDPFDEPESSFRMFTLIRNRTLALAYLTTSDPTNLSLKYLPLQPKTAKFISVKVAGRFDSSGNIAEIDNV
jgi:hypothetical protein